MNINTILKIFGRLLFISSVKIEIKLNLFFSLPILPGLKSLIKASNSSIIFNTISINKTKK